MPPNTVIVTIGDYVHTVAALTIVLQLLERKMKQIRAEDVNSIEHVAAHGMIRTALDYERKVLAKLTDPNGMARLTSNTLETLLSSEPQQAIALLTGETS